ncbi:MAG: CoA-acylating methylmalonate-semialdehyde dehydrogenase [Proteobacteria bacterium]|nr:CoA-acylating methylmalonate-semialdehyde dehydrogenase [Pseudomonadota bacterium]
MSKKIPLLINGKFINSRSRQSVNVSDPATQKILGQVPMATATEINRAVAEAKKAQALWRETPVPVRMRLMLDFQRLLKENLIPLAKIVAQENGKNLEDAKGDVFRGIEVVEFACSIPTLLMGEGVENVASKIDTYSIRQPLGVCAGICPFNFPAMIPLWMFPLAIACGNSFVLKPSEQVPLTAMAIAKLFLKAGAPKGILQVVHGGAEQVNMLLDHPDIRAISFVGSVPVGQHVYRRGCHNLKRVQSLAGAKNHMVIMPDADKEQVISALVGASCGAAGQRCMAISAAVFVGAAKKWLPDVAAAMKKIRPGIWSNKKSAYGPVINQKSLQRILQLIKEGKQSAAECLLDGSRCKVPGYPDGNWLGPTLFSKVTPDMSIYREEIFGPVLVALETNSLDSAIELVNANPYGNGTSIFTASGAAARHFQHHIEAGQVGINLPIPVALPFFSFTGWKGSFYGDLHTYGKQGVLFYSETKTVTARWFDHNKPSQTNMTIQLK